MLSVTLAFLFQSRKSKSETPQKTYLPAFRPLLDCSLDVLSGIRRLDISKLLQAVFVDGRKMVVTNEPNWSIFCLDCAECCSCVPFKRKDWQRLKSRVQQPCVETNYIGNTILPLTNDAHCVFLTNEKRCAVYEQRPTVCRLFGTIPELPCSYAHPDWPQRIPLTQYARFFTEKGISAII